MAHYSLRVTRNKNISKLSDKDWKSIEQEMLEDMYSLIKRHIIATQMSDDTDSSTVIEYDITVETPRIYSDKTYRKQISTDNL